MTRECGAEGGGGMESACSVLPQRRCGCLDLNFVRLGLHTSARHARMAHVSMTNRARHQIERYLTYSQSLATCTGTDRRDLRAGAKPLVRTCMACKRARRRLLTRGNRRVKARSHSGEKRISTRSQNPMHPGSHHCSDPRTASMHNQLGHKQRPISMSNPDINTGATKPAS